MTNGRPPRGPRIGASKFVWTAVLAASVGLAATQAAAFADPTDGPTATVPLPTRTTTPKPVNGTASATPTQTLRSLPQAPPPATPVPTRPLTRMDPSLCRFFDWNESVDNVPRNPWFLEKLQMEQVWRQATGKGIKIAVIDTGISTAGSAYLPETRFSSYTVVYDNQKDVQEGYDCEHGTNVAALIGAERVPGMPSNFGGIAPESEVIGIRALHSSTETQPYDQTVAAIREAVKIPDLRIINISQTGDYDRADYAAAIQEAIDKGIIVVAAAGNRSALEGAAAAYPASYPGVITVGMTGRDGSPAPNSYSSRYQQVTVGAPGVDMVSVSPSDPDWDPQRPGERQIYRFASVGTAGGGNEFAGTSFAAPIVSGVVALLLEQADARGVRLTHEQVAKILRDTADPPTTNAPDPQIGWGIVNPLRALTGVDAEVPTAQPSRDALDTEYPYVHYVEERARNTALISGGILMALVLTGIGARTAIPAARRRRGRPAAPGESFVKSDRKEK